MRRIGFTAAVLLALFGLVGVAGAGADSCPNAQFRTGPSASLPDCRAYELVSPPAKNGTGVVSYSGRTRASADGNALQFLSLGAFGDAMGTGIATDYMAERTGGPGSQGWVTHAITPLQSGATYDELAVAGFEPRYDGEFSSDLSTGVFFAQSPLTDDPSTASVPNLYLRRDLLTPGAGSYQLITHCPLCDSGGAPLPPPSTPADAFTTPPDLAWTSPDGGHVAFESHLRLTADTPPGGLSRVEVYEWDAANGGTVSLAGRVPKAGAGFCDDVNGPACVASPYSIAGQGVIHQTRTPDVISDGSDGHARVFFTFPTTSGLTLDPVSSAGQLYMRVDGTSTVKLNASERATPDAFSPATFLDASKDGERAFFLTSQALTDDTPADGAQHIYMYDASLPPSAPHHLTFINADHELGDGTSLAKVGEGIVGLSDDGDYVYFVVPGQIVSGQPLLGGGYGLYLWHDGTVRYITSLSVDAALFTTGGNLVGTPLQSRVSPDGRWLLYRTPLALGRELFLYSADSGAPPVCISCDPSGAPLTSDATDVVETNSGATTGSWHVNHALSDDGSRVFFSTAQALVPQDVNNKEDVYEYDVASGTVHLISSGTSPDDSWFMDASANGNDVFFTTTQRLVGWDADQEYDVYDARVNGGVPDPPTVAPPCATSEVCLGSPSTVSGALSAGSAVFTGPGNTHSGPKPSAPHCKRGTVPRRHGGEATCVKPRKPKPRRRAGRWHQAHASAASARRPLQAAARAAVTAQAPVVARVTPQVASAAPAPAGAGMRLPTRSASRAATAAMSPAWSIDSLADTTVAPGGTLDFLVETRNVGDAATNGSPTDQIVVTASLPAAMTVVSAGLTNVGNTKPYSCAVTGGSVTCPNNEIVQPKQGNGFQKLSLSVRVDSSASGVLTAAFGVSGGGAAPASTVDPTTVSSSPPGFGIDAFDAVFGDSAGNPLSQAGGHPDEASVSLDFNTVTNAIPLLGSVWPVEPVKDVITDLPAGLVGNPTVADTCTITQLANNNGTFDPRPLCPASSQVGTTIVRIKGGGQGLGATNALGPFPVYNMVPPPGVPAAFGFNVIGNIVVLDGRVRSGGDYGISVDAKDVPEALAIIGTNVTFWGVPADPSHDPDRACPGDEPPVNGGGSCSSGAPLRAFLRLPTSCTAPGVGFPMTVSADSWANPGVFRSEASYSHSPPGYPYSPEDWGPQVGLSGCDRVPFTPTFTAQPESASAGAPSSAPAGALAPTAGAPAAFSFDLSLPQSDDPSQVGESDLKRASVSLPPGVRVNPGSADGLVACSPDEIALNAASAPACPDASKIGTVTVASPLLADPLQGSLYLASPYVNPFGTLLAVYLVATADGVVVKLPGRVDADPVTGQLTVTFDDNPQLPFSDLHVDLFGGPRAPLALPDACGTYSTHASLAPWARRDQPVAIDSSFTVSVNGQSAGCPSAGFSPQMDAGTVNPVAGGSSAFSFRLTRQDGDQNVAGISVTLPPGLVAKLAGIPLCPDAGAATGDCPAASQVGSTTVGTGFGSSPLFIPQAGKAPTAVYLAGPYKGAPYSLVIRVPAQAGPFDLGIVTVRAAIEIDPTTARVSVVSDPLPQIIQGIPLPYRDVRVTVDRPGFMRSPTSCDPMQVTADVTSAGESPQLSVDANQIGYSTTPGQTAHLVQRYQLADCSNLGFSPKLKIALSGRGRTHSGAHPNLTATLTQPAGQANIHSAQVALPLSLALDPGNSQHVCNYDVAQQVHGGPVPCPTSTVIGTATAQTPLLDRPLTGKVYLVQGIRFGKHGQRIHTLPTLLVPLRGQIALDLRATSSVNAAQQLVTTFNQIPDAAVTKFTLNITGGPRGVLVITGRGRTICNTPQTATADFAAQSGTANTQSDTLSTPCANAKPARAKHRSRKHAPRTRRR